MEPQNTTEQVLEELDALIKMAGEVLATTHDENGYDYVNEGLFQKWKTLSLSFLSRIVGKDDEFYTEFKSTATGPDPYVINLALGVLEAMRVAVAAGRITHYSGPGKSRDEDGDISHENASADEKEWDVFISHASEDKESFVEPLARALEGAGLQVWYDQDKIRLGDGIRSKIGEGLAKSRYGVVVLSPSFFEKEWTKRELGALEAQEGKGKKVILPILHGVYNEDLAYHSPMLADRLAVNSSEGLDQVVNLIVEAVAEERDKENRDEKTAERIDRLNEEAIRDHFAGRLEDSVRKFTEVIKLEGGSNWVAFTRRGNSKHNKGDYQGAVNDHSKAIEKAGESYESPLLPYVYRGNANKELGRIEAAIDDYRKAVELDSSHAGAQYHLAACLSKTDEGLKKENRNEVLRHLSTAIRLEGRKFRQKARDSLRAGQDLETYADEPGFLELAEGKAGADIGLADGEGHGLALPSPESLMEICGMGEDQINEFKTARTQPNKMSKEIAAMLHTRRGGRILYGVEDNGEIRGADISRQELDQRVQNSIRNTINPPPIGIRIEEVRVESGSVLVVTILPWDREHVYQFDGRIYIRRGTNCFSTTPEELRALHEGRWID